jgi:hypothetical protein
LERLGGGHAVAASVAAPHHDHDAPAVVDANFNGSATGFATLMMAVGSVWAAFTLPVRVAWMPALVCTAVAVWLWRLPTRRA